MWAQIINVAIGLWLMIAPSALDLEKEAADSDHVTGPIIVTFALIAISESVRNIRHVNLIPGFWLLMAPWFLGYDQNTGIISDMAAGLLVILLSRVEGTLKYTFGGGWNSIFKEYPTHIGKAKDEVIADRHQKAPGSS